MSGYRATQLCEGRDTEHPPAGGRVRAVVRPSPEQGLPGTAAQDDVRPRLTTEGRGFTPRDE